jgi:hypothetical protein
MRLKDGVSLKGVQGQTLLAIQVAESLFRDAGSELVVTSCTDGKHMTGSLHYKGLAFDCRVWNLNPAQVQAMVITLKNALGSEFDVVLEDDHIHVEFDPKVPIAKAKV